MTDADSEAPEILPLAQCGNDIAEAVVATVPTVELESRFARSNIELVMGDENFVGLNTIVDGHSGYRSSALVHVGRRNQQTHIVARYCPARCLSGCIAIGGQLESAVAGQLANKKGTGIVPSAFVLSAGIAKPDDESDGAQG